MILETERLILRKYSWADFEGLYEILSDPETMAHYPKPYDAAGVRRCGRNGWHKRKKWRVAKRVCNTPFNE